MGVREPEYLEQELSVAIPEVEARISVVTDAAKAREEGGAEPAVCWRVVVLADLAEAVLEEVEPGITRPAGPVQARAVVLAEPLDVAGDVEAPLAGLALALSHKELLKNKW